MKTKIIEGVKMVAFGRLPTGRWDYRPASDYHEVHLDKWSYTNDKLQGTAYGHPRFPDGTFIIILEHLAVDEAVYQDALIHTKNTNYRLGAHLHAK